MSLTCQNISYAYNGSQVLHGVSLEVPAGAFCALLGRNGSGKTTLLHCLCGILHPPTGHIVVNGQPVPANSGPHRARCMSLVPQETGQVFPFTVFDLVLMGRNPYLSACAQPSREDEILAWKALKLLNAQHLAPKKVNQISGGERQLAVVARALAQQTPVMLLDEPSNHLDFHNQYRLLYQIRKLCREQKLAVLASMHDPNAVAVVADQVVLLEGGEVIAQGEKEDMLTQKRLSRLYGMPITESRLSSGLKHFMPSLEPEQ
ncbi:MAG: ABC transporter ATP-binding protein [Thermodesulfobacteriota bacterium]